MPQRRKAERKTMRKINSDTALPLMRGMMWLGVLATVATVLLRVWLTPAERDWDTGLFSANHLVIGVMLTALAVLFVLSCLVRRDRQEIAGRASMPTAVVLLGAGAVLVVTGVVGLIGLMQKGAPSTAQASVLVKVLGLLETLFAVLGGVALVRMGLTLVSEGATRRGMAQWDALAPVLWMWFRLAAYEASYASTVRVSNSFFYFVMFILEMLFLFKLARYVTGVGKVRAGMLLFYSMGTALFALSAPVVRVCMYLLQDSEAYLASRQAGAADFAVGLLALTVGISLVHSAAHPVQVEEPEGAEASASSDEASAE